MRGHLAVTTLGDRLHHAGFGSAIQPDVVRQVWRTKRLITLAVHAVAGHAQLLEFFLATADCGRVRIVTAQTEDIISDIRYTIRSAQRLLPGRHGTIAAIEDRGLYGIGVPP